MFFQNCQTVAEVKAEYRKLAFLHHPDVGGDVETMQRLNAAYHDILARLNGEVSWDAQGGEHRYWYRRQTEQGVIDAVERLLKIRMEEVEVAIIGNWVWVTGNTKPYRKELGREGAEFSWHSKRLAWYWKPPFSKSSYSGASLEDLAATYGCTKVDLSEKQGKGNRRRPGKAVKAIA